MCTGGGVPGSLQVREVTIPIVVISPTGDVELAKSLSRQSVPGIELTGEGDTPIPNKGSSMVVLTHGKGHHCDWRLACRNRDKRCHITLPAA